MLTTGLARQIGSTIVLAFAFAGCSKDVTPPTAPPAQEAPLPPSPPPTPTGAPGVLWGYVVDASGACINDATVEIVAGTGLGQRMKQITPCDAWAYANGFIFKDLAAGAELAVRASAPGYRTVEQPFVAAAASGFSSIAIVLSRMP